MTLPLESLINEYSHRYELEPLFNIFLVGDLAFPNA